MKRSVAYPAGRLGRARGGLARWFVVLAVAVAGLGSVGALGLWRNKNGSIGGPGESAGLFAVQRGDLTISVVESGDIKAVNSTDVKCEVEGRTSIVNIVPEGTYISQEDVDNGKVLVELDSSQLKEQLAQREIEHATAEASYAEANEARAIQVKQNESDSTAAELKVKFALMDLKKYLGENLAEGLVAESDPNADTAELIASLLDDPNSLGGEAQQKLRELTGNIALAEANLQNAIYTLNWTETLYQERYVAETELQRDRLDRQRLELEKEKAEISKDLFMRYEFLKQAEQYLSDYKEAQRELERTQARARSQLAQAEAKLTSAKATLELQSQRLAKLRKQLDACVIKAPAVGQVVYWSSTERWTRVKIEQGAEVPEGYKIITIPDMSEMKVEIKVHETWIDKIEIGQKAKISIAAFPDEVFAGKVLKKAPLANPEQWLNPDLKVYSTDVSIEGQHEALKTGMTGKVEVIIDELHDVLYVPIQSVVTIEDSKVCYIAASPAQKRQVQTGLFNDNFVEIKSGLEEGERVLLNPPRWSATEKAETQAEEPNAPTAEPK